MAIQWDQLHVLVIEDEPFMREIASRLLRDIGVRKVFLAGDGVDGMEKCTLLADKLNLILVDLEMPVMNGFQFLSLLRSSAPPIRADIPVLVLTGHSDSGNVKQAIQLGIHGFLVKPISVKALRDRMEYALTKPQIPAERAEGSAAPKLT